MEAVSIAYGDNKAILTETSVLKLSCTASTAGMGSKAPLRRDLRRVNCGYNENERNVGTKSFKKLFSIVWTVEFGFPIGEPLGF